MSFGHELMEIEETRDKEYDVAEAVPPTWWPFALLSTCFFLLSRMAAKMPRSLDAPRGEEEG